jgi:hypothetical protein
MSAPAKAPRRLTDAALIQKITFLSALIEAEIELAFKWDEGSTLRDLHLEKADHATVELVQLINAPQHRAFWQRIAAFVATDDPMPAKQEIAA